uniref:Translation initiation factor eIF2B subunit gamma n=1 Tax=Hemiselmis tepida TaxID=464990 RepID=A0A7S0VX29_9CRYP|mmetsp:Transcript_29258/g.74153  ORF Transcript_29258/g.74153 Transcript_29258/m.74153 type:complete len:440 (+) Transcript_29258:24-1343(+)|eukprot:CAMPEP_0174925750 /NCGR_PEP_ID=MMETSP1355-20121228/8120_1 /TAXON_ID=464990 /ORGANISM="Hemiselmis tepida, Strain CCMP443" /LENGTH=439 /DNA_ID=CAMNT_0016171703 /DNA_START=24 /DNA_END=1343 /DNA_ORIENTATION=-
MLEFQAIILAGGTGTHLYPMTEGVTKCLLPVAGHPLIHYQLKLLEAHGFKEVIVCTCAEAREELLNYVQQFPALQVDLQVVDAEAETADVLRSIKSRITKDFVVVAGDLITDVKIYHLADVHRINDATCTILLRAPKKPDPRQQGAKPVKEAPGPADFVGLDEKGTRLLYIKPVADVEDRLTVPRRQLTQFPNMQVTKKMLDAHLYIFSRWVLDLLDAHRDIASIKTELVPFLVNQAQFGGKPVPGQPTLSRTDVGDDSIIGTPVPRDSPPEAEGESHVPVKCHAMLLEDGYCARADTLRSYREMNFDVPRHGHGDSVPWDRHAKSFGDKTEEERKALSKQVGSECVVGEGFVIGDRSSVKKSVVGKHVTVGANVKIDNCILLGHTSIEDNVAMSGCTVGSNCHVGKESTLSNCNLSARYSVEEESEHKNENLCLEADE